MKRAKKEERVTFRVPKELKAWAVRHARERHTSMSQDYIDFLVAEKSKKEAPRGR